MDAARDDELARAARRLLGQNRRLDLQEVALTEPFPKESDRAVTELEIEAHGITAEIEVAILQPEELVDLGRFIDREGRGAGGIQDLGGASYQFNLAGGEVWILHAGGTPLDRSLDSQDVLGPAGIGDLHGRGGDSRVKDDLRDAPAVSQIDEDQAAMATPKMDPSHQSDCRSEEH